MKKKYFYLMSLMITLFLSIACKKSVIQIPEHSFKIYGYIAYSGYVENGVNVDANYAKIQNYLQKFGINKLNLVYEQKLLDYPNQIKSNAVANIMRIDSIANLSNEDPTTLVSLDMESWNRFNPLTTSPKLIQVINYFKASNPNSQLGLYSTVPVNTYGYSPNIHTTYDKLNQEYSALAAKVDYFSPTLYNYNGLDLVAWKNAAAYNVQACKLYGFHSKKILPYITPSVLVGGVNTSLSYNDMMLRLQYLYDLGANGCIVWTSSNSRDLNGDKLYFDVASGWGKALIDFAAKHP